MNHYQHLTIDQRETIFLMRSQGNSLREIAKCLQISCSTVCQELNRNSDHDRYSPSKAQTQYQHRKQNCG